MSFSRNYFYLGAEYELVTICSPAERMVATYGVVQFGRRLHVQLLLLLSTQFSVEPGASHFPFVLHGIAKTVANCGVWAPLEMPTRRLLSHLPRRRKGLEGIRETVHRPGAVSWRQSVHLLDRMR